MALKIGRFRLLDGPNIYNYKPVLVMDLDLDDLDGRDSHTLPGFVDRLLAWLPGLHEHGCATGAAGAFVERLRTGTYAGHIVEHVALELSEAAGCGVSFGQTRRSASGAGHYDVIVAFTNAAAMEALLRGAVGIVQAAVDDTAVDIAAIVQEASRLVHATGFGPSTAAIAAAAEARGIPVRRLEDGSLLQLGYGRFRTHVRATITAATSAVAVDVASDKMLTKRLLAEAYVPTPAGTVVTTVEEGLAFLASSGRPLVVKPLDAQQGRGVTLGVRDEARFRRAFEAASAFSSRVLVEEQVEGRDYRVLVVGGRVVAASEREPALVIGDGVKTVRELVDLANQDPRRGPGHATPLTMMTIDDAATEVLSCQGLTPESVPPDGARVRLRETANLSTGGTAEDVTGHLHPELSAMCERAARIVGLDPCGVDLIARHVTLPPREGDVAVIELNAAPGIRMHHFPSAGPPRDAGGAIVDALFPPGTPSRVPIVSVTGTNGKTTTARLIAHVLALTGRRVGLTTTDGVYVGGCPVASGDLTGPQSARAVLSDPAVDAAVLETARGGIQRRGLGYDWSDIGVITNVQLDHVGQDGIENLDDLVWVKSLVAERVREDGRLVLNADNPESLHIMDLARVRRIRRDVVLFSLHRQQLAVRRHVAAGGVAYVLDGEHLLEVRGAGTRAITSLSSVPVTFGGTARFNVANVLAAIAACRGLGVRPEVIAEALSRFDGANANPGRVNAFRVGAGFALLDYGHNPAAIEAIGHLVAHWGGRRATAVVTVPGDRANHVVEDAARAAARVFPRVIVREDHDRRGRAIGEAAALMSAAIRREKPSCECVEVLDEQEAVRTALSSMQSGEVVVVFYDDFDATRAVFAQHGAEPIAAIPPLGQAAAVPVDRRRRVPVATWR
jgi:cyanophycin synthetase